MELLKLKSEGFEQLNWAASPVGVYCLLRKGKVVYVGQSESVYRRLAEHHFARIRKKRKGFMETISPNDIRARKIEFDQAMVKWCSVMQLDSIEQELIRQFRPEHNVVIHEKLLEFP